MKLEIVGTYYSLSDTHQQNASIDRVEQSENIIFSKNYGKIFNEVMFNFLVSPKGKLILWNKTYIR